jgi:hypothetical protein
MIGQEFLDGVSYGGAMGGIACQGYEKTGDCIGWVMKANNTKAYRVVGKEEV